MAAAGGGDSQWSVSEKRGARRRTDTRCAAAKCNIVRTGLCVLHQRRRVSVDEEHEAGIHEAGHRVVGERRRRSEAWDSG